MLDIFAIKTQEAPGSGDPEITSFRLDLFPDTSIDIVWENPLFLTDRIPAAFSLSFDMPATPNNLKAFQYPNRVPVVGVIKTLDAEIRHTGVIIAQGQLLLVEFDKHISVQFVGAVANLDKKTPMNEIDMGGKDFGPGVFSGVEWYTENNAAYVTAAANRVLDPNPDPYCHAPVRTNVTDWDGDEALRGAMNALKWYVNFFNPIDKDFFFDPAGLLHMPVVPFLPLHKIISSVFGNTISNNPFTQGDLAKIVIVSVNNPNYNFDINYFGDIRDDLVYEYFYPLTDTGGYLSWDYKKNMQAYRFNEFLKDILKIFGMSLYRGLTHTFEYDDDIFDRTVVQNWDEYLDGDPILIREPGKNYIFEYQGEKADFDETPFSYSTWEALVDTASTGGSTEDEYNYKVIDNPQVVAVKKTIRGLTDQRWLSCRTVKSPLASEAPKIKDESVEVIPALKPMNMSIEQYWKQNHNWSGGVPGAAGDIISRAHWHVPVLEEIKPEDPPRIMLYAGMQPTFYKQETSPGIFSYPHEYPYLTNHHTDAFGNRIFDFSLLPEVTDGIVESFHSRKKAWVEKDKLKLRAMFKLNAQQLKNLDMRDKFYLRGKTFYIEKIEFSLTHNGISKSDATLIET